MTLKIARLVLAVPIGLISGIVLYPCTSRPGTSEVRINVGNVNDEPSSCHVDGRRRDKLMLGCDTVKPDRCTTDRNFAMDHLAVASPLHTSRFETERLNEEVVRCLDVAIHEHWD